MARRTSDRSTPAYSGPWDANVHGVTQWATSWRTTSSLRAHLGIWSTPSAVAVARRCPKPGRTSKARPGHRAPNHPAPVRASTYACSTGTVGRRRPASTSNSAR
jgi:hypothetical protein